MNNNKFWSNPKVIISAVSVFVILVVVVLLAIFNPGVKKIFNNNSSNKEYLKENEIKYFSEKSDFISKKISKVSDNLLSDEGNQYELNINIELTDSMKDILPKLVSKGNDSSNLLSSLASPLFKNIKSITIKNISGISKDECHLSLDLNMNSSDIIKAEIITDIKNGVIYSQIPTVSKDWISFEFPKLDDISSKNTNLLSTALFASQGLSNLKDISKEDLDKLIEKYSSIIFDNLGDVDKKSDELEVCKDSKKCSLLETKLDKDKSNEIVKKVLEESKEDEQLKNLLISLGFVTDSDSYKKSVDSFIEELKKDSKNSIFDSELNFKAWIDSDDNILGNELSSDDTTIGFKCIDDKKKSYSLFMSQGDLLNLKLEGSNEEDDDKQNGYATFILKSNLFGPDPISCDLEYKDITTNDDLMTTGNVKITCDNLLGIVLDTDLSVDGNKQTIKADATMANKKVANITSTITKDKYQKAKVPKKTTKLKVNDNGSLNNYLKTVNLKNVTNNLKKAINDSSFSTLIDALMLFSPYGKLDGKQSKKDIEKILKKS